jgi:hypothetical protein
MVEQDQRSSSESNGFSEIEMALKALLGDYYVLHERSLNIDHIDILVFRPTLERPNWAFVTCGMSSFEMPVPAGIDDPGQYAFIELAIAVPSDWFSQDPNGFIPRAEMEDVKRFWPVSLLFHLSEIPRDRHRWLWGTHSIPNGNPAKTYADNTGFSGAILGQLINWPSEYQTIYRGDGSVVNIFSVMPVYGDEMNAKLKLGYDPVFSALTENGVAEVVDISRQSVAPMLSN